MRKYVDIALIILIIIEIVCISKFKIVVGSGLSMVPTIDDHQVLLCEYSKNYQIDDIVLYKVDNIPIVHRIVNITEYHLADGSIIKLYTMKGDNNPNTDLFETYKENIICKIIGV